MENKVLNKVFYTLKTMFEGFGTILWVFQVVDRLVWQPGYDYGLLGSLKTTGDSTQLYRDSSENQRCQSSELSGPLLA